MTETYTGWDGKSYPWPPPDGWYEASDGRWWAPGTGPNPPPAGDLVGAPGASPQAGDPGPGAGGGYGDHGHAAPGDLARTAQIPTTGQPGPTGQAAARANVTVTSGPEPDPSGRATAPPTAFGDGPPPNRPGEYTNDWDQPPTTTEGGDRSQLARVALVFAGVIAALAVAGGAYLVLSSDDGDDTAADGGDTATDATPDDASGDDGATDTSDGAGDDGSSDTTETTGDDGTSTSQEEDTTTSESTTTTADSTDQVAQFREHPRRQQPHERRAERRGHLDVRHDLLRLRRRLGQPDRVRDLP